MGYAPAVVPSLAVPPMLAYLAIGGEACLDARRRIIGSDMLLDRHACRRLSTDRHVLPGNLCRERRRELGHLGRGRRRCRCLSPGRGGGLRRVKLTRKPRHPFGSRHYGTNDAADGQKW
jgi:hypothetical protein